MDLNKYAHKIIDDLLTLPKDKIVEIADFVHFIKDRVRHQGAPLYETELSREEVLHLRKRLTNFENDWNASGKEVYDDF